MLINAYSSTIVALTRKQILREYEQVGFRKDDI